MTSLRTAVRYLIAFAFFVNASGGVLAHGDGVEKLGTVHFANSCSAEVQPLFERGVALLHSFWYAEGANTFAAVAKADPACAMAHWGTAITLFGNPFNWRARREGYKYATEVLASAALSV